MTAPIRNTLFALFFAAIVAGLLLWPVITGGRPGAPAPAVANVPLAAEVKPAGAPDAEPKATPKVITFAEAVSIAEHAGKGHAVKAERKDRPEPSFRIDVMGRDGQKRKLEVSLSGAVRGDVVEERAEKKPSDARK